MKINEISIDNFGKLSHFSLSPDDGITVVTGGNEAGKSTVGAFVRYVLYGLSGRAVSIADSDKLKYSPWNEAKIGGSLCVTASDGKKYRLERSGVTKAGSKSFDENGERVFAGNDPGEEILGIDLDAFVKSAFVGQSDISAGRLNGFSDVIRRLLFSGEGDASVEEAKKKLNFEKNLIYNTSRKTGTVFELSSRLEELKRQTEFYSKAHRDILSAEFSLGESKRAFDENERKKALLEAEKENLDAIAASEKLTEIAELKKDVEQSRKSLADARESASHNGFLPNREFIDGADKLYYGTLSAEKACETATAALNNAEGEYEIATLKNGKHIKLEKILGERGETIDEKRADEIKARISELADKAEKYGKLAVLFLCLVITFPLWFVMRAKKAAALSEIDAICESYGCENADELSRLVTAYPVISEMNVGYRTRISDCTDKLNSAKAEYSASAASLLAAMKKAGFDDSENANFTAKYADFRKGMLESTARCENFGALYEKCLAKYEAAENGTDMDKLRLAAEKLTNPSPVRGMDTVMRELSFATEANNLLSHKITELEKQTGILTGTIPSPTALISESDFAAKHLSEENEKKDAYLLAMEAIESACEDIRVDAVPRMARRAAELFCRMTDGKYDGLRISGSNMEIEIKEKSESVYKSADFLSVGALDAVYIAIRLAFAECFCREKPPIVFDDSFANLDSERLSYMLSLLVSLSSEYQIIIFSCHDREAEMLRGKAKIAPMK